MADKQKILELLGSGLSNEIVADAVGVDSSYIAQLLSDEDFQNEVIKLRTLNLTAATDRDKRIDKIEDALIDKLSETVEYLHKPGDILRSFAVLNAAKRRGIPAQLSAGLRQSVISLTLPSIIVRSFTKTAQGEVVGVEMETGSQTLVTMPTGQLLAQLAKESNDGSAYEKLQRYLPGTSSGK